MNCSKLSTRTARPPTSIFIPRPRNLYSKNWQAHLKIRAQTKQNGRTKVDGNDGFDSLELNEEYYKEVRAIGLKQYSFAVTTALVISWHSIDQAALQMGMTAEQAAEQLDQVLNEAADGFRPVEEEALNDEDFYDDDEPPFGPLVSCIQQ